MFLSEKDLSRLAERFGGDLSAFVEKWCRWVPYTPGRQRLSLREKPNLDCVFWDGSSSPGENGGCSVYGARPLQCRTYPFWDSVVSSKGAWDGMAAHCPGMNSGRLHSGEEIDGHLRGLENEPIVERRIQEVAN